MDQFWEFLLGTTGGYIIIAFIGLCAFVGLSALFYKGFFKRFYDIFLSGLAIVLLSPVLLVLMVAGAIKMKGNPFFTQLRPGKGEKIFKLVKFRTMTNERDENGNLLPDSKRLTRYGKILRSTSLDELPELFNIFAGQMSIVGPRPLLPKYLPYYTDEERHRHDVRPGLTGLAQVNGRNAISWDDKFAYDVKYVKNISLIGDIKIIIKTVLKVVKRSDIQFDRKKNQLSLIEQRTQRMENKKKALVLCGGIPQTALIKELKSRNITTVLADMNEKVGAREFADIFYPVSVLDVEAVKEVAIKEKVDFIITVCADQVLLVVAQLSEELGLPCYIDFKTAENVSKKSYMKKIFLENDVPTSKHVIMKELSFEAISDLSYPLIVKPVDAYSSRGVCKVYNEDELAKAFDIAKAISREKNVIVEEFVEGEELTIDVYVENGQAHILGISNSDKIGEDGKFVIHRTRYPAMISDEIRDAVERAASNIARAFKLENSPMLVQLISDGKRISVIEFCARTGGGVKFRLIEKVSGFNVVNAVVDLTLGKKPHYEPQDIKQKYIINEFLYCYPGEFDHLEGFEELLSEGIITEYSQFKSKGAVMNQINSSGDRVAYFTIEEESYEEAQRKHAIANERIKAISKDGNDMIRHDLVNRLKQKI